MSEKSVLLWYILAMQNTLKDSGNIIEINNLSLGFDIDENFYPAIHSVNFDIQKGKMHAIVGESGCGKTMTVMSILRLLQKNARITNGEILFEDKNLLELKEKDLRKIRGRKIALIPQDPMTSLNPVMTVGEQIAEVIEVHEKISKAEATKRAKEMLELVGIPGDRSVEYPHQFSGGMKQRVIIAIALACNPKLLIADEPTTALDVTIQAQILEIMRDLKKKYNTAMIMITHDLGIVAEMCDEVSVIYAGRIVEHGNLEDVFDHTAHPYTEGLFNSLPNVKDRKAKLKPIPGLMPDPTNLPKGCAFAPRCSYATEACKEAQPEVTWLSDTHYIRCAAYKNPNFKLTGRDN